MAGKAIADMTDEELEQLAGTAAAPAGKAVADMTDTELERLSMQTTFTPTAAASDPAPPSAAPATPAGPPDYEALLKQPSFNQWIRSKMPEWMAPDQGKFPELEEGPDLFSMPEFRHLSPESAKAIMGTLVSGADETKKIIETQFPKVKVEVLPSGYMRATSGEDGKPYMWRPGPRPSDAARMGGAALAAVPIAAAVAPLAAAALPAGVTAGVAGLGTAVVTGGLSALQHQWAESEAGGDFNLGPIVAGAALPVGIRGVQGAAGLAGRAVKGVVNHVRPGTFAAPPVTAPVPQIATPQDFGGIASQLAKGAREGDEMATAAVTGALGRDAGGVAAAQRTGVLQYLDPDHLAANTPAADAAVDVLQQVKTFGGSKAGAGEKAGIKGVVERFKEVVQGWGANPDKGALSYELIERTKSALADLKTRVNAGFKTIRENVPADAEVDGGEVIPYLLKKAEALRDGVAGLSPLEKRILRKLSQRTKKIPDTSPRPPAPPVDMYDVGKTVMSQEGFRVPATSLPVAPRFKDTVTKPTYMDLDTITRLVGRLSRANAKLHPDKDISGAKSLYGMLVKARDKAAGDFGQGGLLAATNAHVVLQKEMEKTAIRTFGQNFARTLEGTIAPKIVSTGRALAAGNVDPFIQMMKAAPDDMKPELAATTLYHMLFAKAGGDARSQGLGHLVSTMDKLEVETKAYNAVMHYLDPAARDLVRDMVKVSKGITRATGMRKDTGRLGTAFKPPSAADDILSKVYNIADTVAGTLGLFPKTRGALRALAFRLSGSDTPTHELADKLITSPLFAGLVTGAVTPKGITPGMLQRVGASAPWRAFADAAGIPILERSKVLQALVQQSAQRAIQSGPSDDLQLEFTPSAPPTEEK